VAAALISTTKGDENSDGELTSFDSPYADSDDDIGNACYVVDVMWHH